MSLKNLKTIFLMMLLLCLHMEKVRSRYLSSHLQNNMADGDDDDDTDKDDAVRRSSEADSIMKDIMDGSDDELEDVEDGIHFCPSVEVFCGEAGIHGALVMPPIPKMDFFQLIAYTC